jgi:hypothetical protein
VGDRVLNRRDRFPRTALILFGVQGLERRNALSTGMQRRQEELESETSLFTQYTERQAAIDEIRTAT